ncbi:MAG TPA: hypothetical protein VMT88_08960 [Actinomycetes bacterium]|nr:hypothetical protein [Actinomycetes bacterium]
MRLDDEGSMLFAMLGVLIVSGLMVAILMTVLMGQRSIRYDQRFDASGQGADAGVQQAFFAINSLDYSSTSTSLSSSGPVTIGSSSYTWTATRPTATSLTWTVNSTATTTSAGVTTTRKVSAQVRQNSIFTLAAFADSTLNLGGNNTATSYPTSGLGGIATNGTISMNGSSTTVDSITFYDWAANPNTSRCSGSACTATTTYTDTKLDIGSAVASTGFIQAQIDECKAAGPLTAFVGSTIAARSAPYCFTSFYADTDNFTVTGTGNARIFVEGGDVVLGDKNHAEINYDVSSAPNSIKLQIYTTGNTVSMYNQGHIAASLYAPNAACSAATSNAATDFYGSMICKSIDNVGGWTFHYDTRLSDVGDGTWRIKDYAEPQS